MDIKAIKPADKQILPYGKLIRFTGPPGVSGDGWQCWMTKDFILDQGARIGIENIEEGVPYRLTSMKRHIHSKKLFAPGPAAIVIALAAAGKERLRGGDAEAFILEPGELLVIDRGTWYSPCCSAGGSSFYYFASLETAEDTNRGSIEGSPVSIVI
jgi:ureidoglycolate lyase